MAPLHKNAKTCSPVCSRNRERRAQGVGQHIGSEWICKWCGASLKQANRKRRLRGFKPLYSTKQRYCTSECSRAFYRANNARLYRRPYPGAPYRRRSA